jgi:predicted membrane protein
MPPEFVPHDTRLRFTPQLVVGLIVIAVGVLMTLDNLELVDASRYLRFWPAALIVLGVVKIWHSREGMGGSFGGFLFVVIGAWLLLEQTALVRISFWDMWPALLVAFGMFLVWKGIASPRRRPSVMSNDLVSAMAVLGGVSQGNNSPAFRGGDLTAVLGGCELDLRHAAIDGEAVIEVFAMWGGIEIRVPQDWTVVSHITPIMGGVDDQTRPPQAAAARHRLVLRGFIAMAGVEIKN